MADSPLVTNRLLRVLARSALAKLLLGMEFFALRLGTIIDHVDRPVEHMNFINRADVFKR